MTTQTAIRHDFSGVITALITPFKNGKVDFRSLKRLVEHQLENGISGFVINGTTAESPNLSDLEVEKIFRFIKKLVASRVPLILGTGSNSTAVTALKTKKARALKADAALIVTPYYNKPPQRGIVAHVQAVTKAAPKTKIILYNVPSRTVVGMSSDTIVSLSKLDNVIGVKEASGKVELVAPLRAQTKSGFLLTSGDDSTCIDFMLAGGDGVISVVSHVIPKQLTDMSLKARQGDQSARRDLEKIKSIIELMGSETNPIPVKMALYLMGLIDSPELRLPLVPLAQDHKQELTVELKRFSLLAR